MPQQTFAEVSFEQYRNPTRRERFLDEMTRVVPWAELVAVIEPIYPKAAGPGRPPVGVERRLRLHCLQQWFTLSDPAVEEAEYDSRAMRHFVGIDLGREPMPEETTICKFRHLLEAHQRGDPLVARIGADLAAQGFTVSRGTLGDATIISAPRSTKTRQQERDPERQQTKKGHQGYFGMTAHSGVASRTHRIPSVAPRRPMGMTGRCCRSSCRARRRGSGAPPPPAGRTTCFGTTLRRPSASSRPKPLAIGC